MYFVLCCVGNKLYLILSYLIYLRNVTFILPANVHVYQKPMLNKGSCTLYNSKVLKTMFTCATTVEPLLYDHPQNHIGVVV